jgi:transposase InsO family protein
LKYERLYRAPIDDGGALAMETARFRDIYNRIRPHQALDDRTPRQPLSRLVARRRCNQVLSPPAVSGTAVALPRRLKIETGSTRQFARFPHL